VSDPFYDVLFPPLPLDEAAEAFLSLKTAGHRISDEDDRLLAEAIKTAGELTQAGREEIKPKNFAIPKGNGPGDTGKYPIQNSAHASNALARVDQHGTPKEKSQVYAAVAKKYPGLAARSSVPAVQEKAKRAGFDSAVERMKTAHALFKKADEGETEGEIGGTAMAPPSPPMAPDPHEFLAAEQAGREVEEQQASQYYAERLRQKAEELGILQQQVQELQQSGDAATQQLQTMQETQGVADQATQAAKQMALENAQQANAAAEQAMAQTQQAMADSTQAKLQLQQMRATLLQLAGQDTGIAGMGSPGAVPGAGQGAPGTPVIGAPGGQPQDPNAPAGAAAAQDPSASPAGGTEATQAPSSGASEPSQPSSGGASSSPQQAGGSTAGSNDASKVQVKVGAKTAAHPALVGGLLGGAAGAGLAGMEAAGHGPDPEAQQAKIDALEQGSHEPGLGGFAKSFELAKERALQTLGTATREHPALATLAGGAFGASVGASAGPHIASGLREAASYYRGGKTGGVAGLLGG
jgi:hypothetical protein